MLSPSRKRPLIFLAFCFLFSRQFTLAQDMLDTLQLDREAKLTLPVPPRPAEPVLDNAHFLSEDMRRTLNDALSVDARDAGVSVYLLTVPTLPKNALGPYTKQVAEEWTTGLFGAVVVFDDGTGLVALERSELVSQRFYEFELSALLKESMRADKRPRLSREGLLHTVGSLSKALKELKQRADRDDRNALYMKIGAALFAALVVIAGGTVQIYRNRPPAKSVRSTD